MKAEFATTKAITKKEVTKIQKADSPQNLFLACLSLFSSQLLKMWAERLAAPEIVWNTLRSCFWHSPGGVNTQTAKHINQLLRWKHIVTMNCGHKLQLLWPEWSWGGESGSDSESELPERARKKTYASKRKINSISNQTEQLPSQSCSLSYKNMSSIHSKSQHQTRKIGSLRHNRLRCWSHENKHMYEYKKEKERSSSVWNLN